jgi:hypothetical protein
MMPPIEVILPTLSTEQYDRREILHETVRHLRENLQYSGERTFLISADGLDPTGLFTNEPDVRIITGLASLGANLNNALQHATTDFYYQHDDDIWLLEPLSIDRHVKKLMDDETAGMIRLWGIGCHNIRARLDGEYWRCDMQESEVYLISMRPHVKHRRFHDWYGLYPAGVPAGAAEEGMGYQAKAVHRDKGGGPDVLVPLIGVPFDNIYQHVGVDSLRIKGF